MLQVLQWFAGMACFLAFGASTVAESFSAFSWRYAKRVPLLFFALGGGGSTDHAEILSISSIWVVHGCRTNERRESPVKVGTVVKGTVHFGTQSRAPGSTVSLALHAWVLEMHKTQSDDCWFI